ncbi:aspartate aminotransferase [Thraustotheca clavata]|uniref:Aspartate aminotransferase n=1 Tax=Thraustotheca clavata TaxID=74557 RepID=A0A1V9Y8J1_9STRA|nr:aspartate aminotransferase [Thraustotheca clavata]
MDSVKKTDDQKMLDAVNAVVYGHMSIRLATKKFGVVRSTLQRRVHSTMKELPASPIAKDESAMELDVAVPIVEEIQPEVVKGPHKVINCKVRTMQTAAGSAIDELSNEMIRAGRPVYKLGLGQSPFPIPECLVDELKANAHQRDYLPVAGLAELRQDIAEWASESLNLPYTKDDVLVGPGTKELLFVLQTVYYGDLLLPSPSCTSYAPQANIAGRNMIWLPTYAEDRWVLRPSVLEAQCISDPHAPRILILNSPSNPTGCSYGDEDLKEIAALAKKYRMLVVSDEIYSDLTYEPHISISKYYPEGTIVSGGLSKWCGAGGWRVGFWLFSSSLNWLRQSMLVMASETYTSVASPIQYAARRAFVPNCPELFSYKQKCRRTLQVVAEWCTYQLHKMNIQVHAPQGGFYVFPCFRNYRQKLASRNIHSDVEMCQQLLADTGVAILPGSYFGRTAQELYARIAFVDFKGDIAMYVIGSEGEYGVNDREGFIRSMTMKNERNRSFMEAMERLGSPLLEPKDVQVLMRGPLEPLWLWVAQNVHSSESIAIYRRNLEILKQEVSSGRIERRRKREACIALKEKKMYLERRLNNLRDENRQILGEMTTLEQEMNGFKEAIQEKQRSQVLLRAQGHQLRKVHHERLQSVLQLSQKLATKPQKEVSAVKEIVLHALSTLEHDCAAQRQQIDPPVTDFTRNLFEMCYGLDILQQLKAEPNAFPKAIDSFKAPETKEVDTLASVQQLLQERQQEHINQFVQATKQRLEMEKRYPPLLAIDKDEACTIAQAIFDTITQYEQQVEAQIAQKQALQAHIQQQVDQIQTFTHRCQLKTHEISTVFQRNRALVMHVIDQQTQLLNMVQSSIMDAFLGRFHLLEQGVAALGAEERSKVVFPKLPTRFIDKISDQNDVLYRVADSLDLANYGNIQHLVRALDSQAQLRLYNHIQRILAALEAHKADSSLEQYTHSIALVKEMQQTDANVWNPHTQALLHRADTLLTSDLACLKQAIDVWYTEPALKEA